MAGIGPAFNHGDFDFSDRLLHIETISDELLDSKSDSKESDRSLRKRKFGSQTLKENETQRSESKCLKVESLPICSSILAAKSPFFYKLFKNGMKESQQEQLTLRINVFEEAPLLDMLNFMYNYTLRATTIYDLLNVLIIADKFEVKSCMRYCSDLLLKLPMSPESANTYLELPSAVLMSEEVQPLKDEATRYLDSLNELQEEAMKLPLSAIEILLSSDNLRVNSEEDVYEFMLKWMDAHYPEPREKKEILNRRLVHLIRFPYMCSQKLSCVLVNPNFDHEQVSKLVREALFFKAGLPHEECAQVKYLQSAGVTNHRFIERAYKYRPIRVVQFEPLWSRCVVYFDLKKDDCETLFPSRMIYSQRIHLNGHEYCLSARCRKDVQMSSYHFGLYVKVLKYAQRCTLGYEFEVRKKPTEEFQSVFKNNFAIITKGEYVGKENLFGISWIDFMAEDSEYFINGILRFRVELIVTHV